MTYGETGGGSSSGGSTSSDTAGYSGSDSSSYSGAGASPEGQSADTSYSSESTDSDSNTYREDEASSEYADQGEGRDQYSDAEQGEEGAAESPYAFEQAGDEIEWGGYATDSPGAEAAVGGFNDVVKSGYGESHSPEWVEPSEDGDTASDALEPLEVEQPSLEQNAEAAEPVVPAKEERDVEALHNVELTTEATEATDDAAAEVEPTRSEDKRESQPEGSTPADPAERKHTDDKPATDEADRRAQFAARPGERRLTNSNQQESRERERPAPGERRALRETPRRPERKIGTAGVATLGDKYGYTWEWDKAKSGKDKWVRFRKNREIAKRARQRELKQRATRVWNEQSLAVPARTRSRARA